jgi:folate-binding protein YgfZ
MLSPAPNPFKDGTGPLPGFSLLSCIGPEASAFLQAQLMNDLRALAPGQWQWNGWLNAKGRVICLFALLRRQEQDFLLVLPDFPAAELQPLLQRFVFRSKLKLAVETDWAVHGRFGGAAGEGARDRAATQGPGWSLDFGGEGGPRHLLLMPCEAEVHGTDPGFESDWRQADLRYGLPRLDSGQREAWTPQMLSLQRLEAFSLAKGCYPGQEIVARTHYLGQAKRELALLEGQSLLPGATVSNPEGSALGTIVGTGADGRLALAVLSAARGEGPLSAESGPVHEIPLWGGLKRPA